MTIASQQSLSGPYLCNGVTREFDYHFKIFDSAHLSVVLHGSDGGRVVANNGVDYSVTGVGSDGGGKVVMNVAPEDGKQLTITRDVPFVQEVDLENQGAFFLEVIERAFDEAVIRDQQLKEELGRAVVIGENVDVSAKDALVRDITKLAEQSADIATVAGMGGNINKVAGNMGQIVALAVGMGDINTVATNANNILAVKNNASNINTVAGKAADITTVAGISSDITSVKDNATNIGAVANRTGDVSTVAGNMSEIATVAENVGNINEVAENMGGINEVRYHLSAIDSVNYNWQNIGTVAGYITHIRNVSEIQNDVLAVSNNAANINTVRNNVANINTVANMDVSGVVAAAEHARQWAVKAEDSAVNDGTNPTGFSAYHWAQKAAISAAEASSAAGLNPDDYLKKTGGTITGALTVKGAESLISYFILDGGGYKSYFYPNGDIHGPTWNEWGSSFAKAAISNRIEERALAIAEQEATAALNDFKNNPEFFGDLKANEEIHAKHVNAMRIIGHNSSSIILRKDSNNFYFLLTNAHDPYGSFNALRPFYINLTTGRVSMNNGLTVFGGIGVHGGVSPMSANSSEEPSQYNADGNVYGEVWKNWHSSGWLSSAIDARITARLNAHSSGILDVRWAGWASSAYNGPDDRSKLPAGYVATEAKTENVYQGGGGSGGGVVTSRVSLYGKQLQVNVPGVGWRAVASV